MWLEQLFNICVYTCSYYPLNIFLIWLYCYTFENTAQLNFPQLHYFSATKKQPIVYSIISMVPAPFHCQLNRVR